MRNSKFLCYKTPIIFQKNWDLQRKHYSFSNIYASNQILGLFLERFSYKSLFWYENDVEMGIYLFISLKYERFLRIRPKNSIFDDKIVIFYT